MSVYVKTENYTEGTVPQCYAVLAKCGHDHVRGRACFIPVVFGIVSKKGRAKEVAQEVRALERVKHDHPDAILFVLPVSYEQYKQIRVINDFDPYLAVQNKRDQLEVQDIIDTRAVNEAFEYVDTRKVKNSINYAHGRRAVYRQSKDAIYDDYQDDYPYEQDYGENFDTDDLILQRYAAAMRDHTAHDSEHLRREVLDVYIHTSMQRLMASEHKDEAEQILNNFEHYHKGIKNEKYREQ